MSAAAFVWETGAKREGLAVADYDHRRSRTHSAEIVTTLPLDHVTADDIVLRLPHGSPSRLSTVHILPNMVRCPLVDDRIADVIVQFAGDEVQVVPTTVCARTGNILRFSYVRPLVGIPCMDVEKSDIADWIVPGKVIMDARRLVFVPGCLGSRHFARDTYTGYVTVSNQLKNEILACDPSGPLFSRPEDVWNIYS